MNCWGIRYFVFIFNVMVFLSCEENKFDVPLENTVSVDVVRFDIAFDSLRTTDDSTLLPSFIERYQNWLSLYSNQIIRTGDVNAKMFPGRIASFYTYPEYLEVTKDIQRIFPLDSSLKVELSQAYSYYHHYFPQKNIPSIYTYNGGFNQSIVIGEGLIGVGLDKYLGADSDYYYQLGIDKYKIKKMHAGRVALDVLTAQFIAEHPTTFEGENVLAEILHEGRCMYLLNACFPFVADSLLWGVSSTKMLWLENSERSMWEYLIDKKILFNTEYLTIKKFTGDGPFTTPFSKESPARAAVWVGYRIVSQFMENTNSTMEQLFEISDYQYILNKSKYNPS